MAYLIAGALIGPHGFTLIGDQWNISQIGSIGVLLLLFFVGMEISLYSDSASKPISVNIVNPEQPIINKEQ